MSRYHQSRSQLRKLLEAQFTADAQVKGHPDTPELKELVSYRTAVLLDDFEQVVNKHNQGLFWRGVWQSFLGSLLFLLTLALFAFLIYGNRQNPFRILTEDVPASSHTPKTAP